MSWTRCPTGEGIAHASAGESDRGISPTGSLGIVGVYLPKDPGGKDKNAKEGKYLLPWAEIFDKGLRVGSGQTPVKQYNAFRRDLISAGRAKPSFIVSQRIELSKAPEAYEKFDRREPGYTKVVIKPGQAATT